MKLKKNCAFCRHVNYSAILLKPKKEIQMNKKADADDMALSVSIYA